MWTRVLGFGRSMQTGSLVVSTIPPVPSLGANLRVALDSRWHFLTGFYLPLPLWHFTLGWRF
jgi:hypothetical protein